jgi:hypothetical protein
VRIEQGEVAVYYDSESPPVGEGLNRPALVALHNVHKVDKATGRPTSDPQVRRPLQAGCGGPRGRHCCRCCAGPRPRSS